MASQVVAPASATPPGQLFTGRITIADREGLLKRSCACVEVIHREERRLRDTDERYDIGSRSAR